MTQLPFALLAMLGIVALVHCDNDPDPFWDGEEVDPQCRSTPQECGGDIGGRCVVDDDCDNGICCTNDDCARGMCTYTCSVHADCPPEMMCDGGYCFFTCSAVSQCAAGQQCHGEMICQWD